MKNRFLFFFVLTALCLWATISEAQLLLTDTLPIDKNVKIGKLKNGLTYYLRRNSRPENKLELRLVVNAGSILEEDDQQGLAHFTEHMAFNGSKHFKKNDIVSFLQSIGVEFGADLNAYTGFDETVYILPIPTEKKENVEKAFQILEDWASSISFDNNELEKERGIVLEEERLGKGAEERMFRVTYPRMFEGSKYANRLPIGKPEIIKTFKADVIKRFYRDWYRPDLMAVVAVGDYDTEIVEALIKKHFEHLKNPAKVRPRENVPVFPRTKSEALVVTDKEATNHVIEIYYSNRPTVVKTTIRDFRDYMIRSLFRNMLNQRLQELTQKATPPFIFGGSSIGGWARNYEAFNSVAYVGNAGPEAAIGALVQENERARKFGFTEGELSRTKKMMMKNMERSFNERDKTDSEAFTDDYVRHFLEHDPIPGIEEEYQYFKSLLDGISIEDVNKKTAELTPDSRDHKLVIFTGPDSAEYSMPTAETLLQFVERASTADITPYQDKSIATNLLKETPHPGTIIEQKENSKLGITDLKLSNGIRILLKPTDFKNDQVVLVGSRFGGQHLADPAERFNAEYATAIISQMGVGDFSPLDLRKFLAGKNANVSMRISATSEGVSGQSSAQDLETMLQLVHLNFTAPRIDPDLFTSFITKQQAYYKNMNHDPEFIFQDSLLKILYGNHPWAPKLPTAERLGKLDLQKAISFYKSRFENADGFNFVITGKFEIETIKPMLLTYLGSLPSQNTSHFVKDVGLRPVKGVIKKEIKKGSEQKSQVRLFWNGEAPFSERDNFILSLLVDVLNIKLTESLREEISGMYSGDVYGSLNKYPYQHYAVGITLPCGPENVQTLITAALTEIEKIKKQGPQEADLSKAKETKRQQHLVDLKENSYWARRLLQSIELGTDPESILAFDKNLASITSKDLQSAANKYFDMNNFVQIVLNPE
jgi:zinc protease